MTTRSPSPPWRRTLRTSRMLHGADLNLYANISVQAVQVMRSSIYKSYGTGGSVISEVYKIKVTNGRIGSCSLSAYVNLFFFSSRRRHTRFDCDWSSDVCSSD